MRHIAIAIVAAALATTLPAGAASQTLTGQFAGTGRACYGRFAVGSRTISWVTPFSRCRELPYEIIDHNESSGKLRITYRFTRESASCRYRIVSLTHDGSADREIGWEVTGYWKDASYRIDKDSGFADRAPDMMSCYLVRAPNTKARRP
ncbi:hypothetical protein [Massilia cavernae]|uniref:Uncharacterized protein n=1 Tax=Massilia cavernae TaxID=2320864 RepID=A0A418XGF1_9BURK|nr:hypothetical protein [Massilia cavernae]RJG11539.1 hypothetical protein D3872_19295 [Massilia cavernae]